MAQCKGLLFCLIPIVTKRQSSLNSCVARVDAFMYEQEK